MADTSSATDAYLVGGIHVDHSKSAFIASIAHGVFSKDAFVHGCLHVKADTSAYTIGGYNYYVVARAWLTGGDVVSDSQVAFLKGGTDDTSSASAYCSGVSGHKARISVYLDAIERTSVHAMLEGDVMANDYIWLRTDDSGATLSKKFRVIAEGYDDGTMSKSMSIEKTIGGGVDASMGEVYKSWAPIIKVRHTEPISDYGTLDDLKTFYSYSDPGGTPSNRITFIDHHGSSYTIVFVGELKKQMLSAIIVGEDAWSIVAVLFQEIK